jgi:hypothetical protein
MPRISMFEDMDLDSVSQTVRGSVASIPRLFQYQSFFDSTALEQAILTQPQGEAIISSTGRDEEIGGYSVTLHPRSETPVAIRFKASSKEGNSYPIILTPGQSIRPFGTRAFQGFRWGLPFGWLGGGLATIVVTQDKDLETHFKAEPREMIFHRTRMLVRASAFDFTAFVVPPNWPTRFPWAGAIRAGVSPINQAGASMLSVQPTRTQLRFRQAAQALPCTVRFIFYGSNAFDLNSVGVIDATALAYEEVGVPSIAAAGLNGAAQYPTVEVQSGLLASLGAELAIGGGVAAISMGDGGNIDNTYVDVVRYGTL